MSSAFLIVRGRLVEVVDGRLTIPYDEYVSLVNSSDMLTALENAGVDNWSGYDYATEEFYGDDND